MHKNDINISFDFLEHLNIVLFELARTYHAALRKVDVSEFGSDDQGVQDFFQRLPTQPSFVAPRFSNRLRERSEWMEATKGGCMGRVVVCILNALNHFYNNYTQAGEVIWVDVITNNWTTLH